MSPETYRQRSPHMFQLRSMIVDARQVTHAERHELARWCKGHPWASGVIVTCPGGEVHASIGDWIVFERPLRSWQVYGPGEFIHRFDPVEVL